MLTSLLYAYFEIKITQSNNNLIKYNEWLNEHKH